MDREARTRIKRPAAQGGLRDHELARLVQTLPRDDPRREAACEQLVKIGRASCRERVSPRV